MGKALHAHLPCSDCGSSDALSIYVDGTYCFSCDTFRSNDGEIVVEEKAPKSKTNDNLHVGTTKSMPRRNITSETCLRYSVTIGDDGHHYYPYFNSWNEHIANKIRGKDKKFISEGDIGSSGLFGQQVFKKGGKFVTLCEGELDALSAHQMFDNKWPCLSLKTGAAGASKDVEENYEYLMSFDNIVICFDNDKVGIENAKKVAELLSPKAKIMKLRYKDASDYLMGGKETEFVADWWNAECYTPDGIVAGKDLWDTLIEGPVEAKVDYPFAGLNNMAYGIREGELITICAGTGIGKSSFIREIVYHIFQNTKENIGLMFMEENVRTTAESLMSLHINKPLHLPDTKYTNDEYKKAFNEVLASDRFYFFDHFGSNTIENVIARIRYLVRALGCRYVVLDHISILVSSQEGSLDERKTIDACVTKLRTLVQELGITLFMVSHLRRPSNGSHETNSVNVSLSDLRGSHSIGQLSDLVIGLERNGQADCIIERHTTYVRVIKNRFSGLTGQCTKLYYDYVTGRITEAELLYNKVEEL